MLIVMNEARRNFLFGGFRRTVKKSMRNLAAQNFILRPPGAVEEGLFAERCPKECTECLKVCPPKAIVKLNDPISQNHLTAHINEKVTGCDYCLDYPCIKACPHGALTMTGRLQMGKADLLANCLTKQLQQCNMCISSCPSHVGAIVKDRYGRVKIDSDICVGCGKCVASCFLTPKAVELLAE